MKVEQEIILHNWLTQQNDVGKRKGDHCSATALAWWSKHDGAPLEITGWAMRRLCRHASSATSERAFSDIGLIVSKKRQWLLADHVDGTNLMG